MWWLLLTAVFTPSAELFHSALDGAWQFGEVVERIGPSGQTEVLVEENGVVMLNSAGEPRFLVDNRFDWEVEGNSQPLWLEVAYQPWSQETERGFDEPFLVIFLDEELIFKRSIAEICCRPQQEKLYLGELTGSHQLSFFAGETGDLNKPSGVIIESLKILGELVVGNNVQLLSAGPETIVTGNSASSIEIEPQASETIITESLAGGEVLGVEDDLAEENVVIPWQFQLKKLLEKPWFIGIIWLTTGLLIYGFVTLRVMFKRHHKLSNKN